MPKIRILVVDDSVVVRRMVSDALASDPQLEIAGTAANGKIALAKIPQVNPDIVILDVEMPELDGHRHAGGDPQVATSSARHHVQHPYPAWRGSHPRCALQGCYGLCHQAFQRRKCRTGVGMHSDATDSEDQSDLWPCLGVTPSLLSGHNRRFQEASRRAWHLLVVRSESTLLPSECPRADPMPLPVSFQAFRATFPSPWSSFNTCLPSLPASWRSAWLRSRKYGVEEGYTGAVLKPGCAWIAPGDLPYGRSK